MKLGDFNPWYNSTSSNPGKNWFFNFLKNSLKNNDDKFNTWSSTTWLSDSESSKINSSGPFVLW